MGHLSGHKRTKIVLWEAAGKTQHNEPKVSTGIEVKTRWTDKHEESLNALNQTIRTDASILVDRDIPLLSIVWKDSLADLPSPVTDVTDLYQVVTKFATPNLKNRQTIYRYQLIRFGDTLPTIV